MCVCTCWAQQKACIGGNSTCLLLLLLLLSLTECHGHCGMRIWMLHPVVPNSMRLCLLWRIYLVATVVVQT